MTASRLPDYALRLTLFLITLLIYLQALPYLLYTWAITGDEPHYLLAAHSLVYDHDLDLGNNYAQRDYASFYVDAFLDPHVKVQPNGAQLLSHDLGLPILIAPAYALGARLGVTQFFAVLGALLAVQMFLLSWEVTGHWWAGLLGWGAMTFSAPLALYVFQIYPEMPGSLIVMWAMRQILQTPHWPKPPGARKKEEGLSVSVFLLLPTSLAVLPWLSGRYVPLLLLLVALVLWKHWSYKKLWLTVSGFALASITIYLVTNYALYGGPTPSATVVGNAVSAGFGNIGGQQIPRGLAGWWLDQQRGLLVYGPILIVAFIGVPHLWRLRGLDGLLLFAPVLILWLLASVWGGFYIGWEISARFLMVGVPLLVAGIGAAFVGVLGRARLWLFYPLTAALLTLSILNTLIVILKPFVAFHESPVRFYEEATRWQLRPWLPAMGTRMYLVPHDRPDWQAAAGQTGYVYQSPALDNLSVGWYRLYAQAQISGVVEPTANVLGFDIYSSETGIPLLHADVRAAEANDSGAIEIALPFFNPYLNKWDFPFYLDIQSTGAAQVRLSPLLLEPDPLPTFGRAVGWVAGIVMLTILLGWPTKSPNAA